MHDIEKVIKGLENCLHYKGHCLDCPYNSPNCQNDVLNDAIALLKEQENNIHHMALIIDEYEKELKKQEAKAVEWRLGRAHCPSCGELFPKKQEKQYIRFCNWCGQAVKWNE